MVGQHMRYILRRCAGQAERPKHYRSFRNRRLRNVEMSHTPRLQDQYESMSERFIEQGLTVNAISDVR